MASRNRSKRIPSSPRQRRRCLPPLLENLETRLVMTTTQPIGGQIATGLYTLASGSTVRIAESEGVTVPSTVITAPTLPTSGVVLSHAPVSGNSNLSGPSQQSPSAFGYFPNQVVSAYGINQVMFGSIKGNGAGQTIGIYEEGSNPAFVDTSSPNFATSDLAIFDKRFGLPDPPSLTFFDGNGNPITATNPGPGDEGAGVEIALDIEWVHAIAPAANIDVVNGIANAANFYDDIPKGMATLAKLAQCRRRVGQLWLVSRLLQPGRTGAAV